MSWVLLRLFILCPCGLDTAQVSDTLHGGDGTRGVASPGQQLMWLRSFSSLVRGRGA